MGQQLKRPRYHSLAISFNDRSREVESDSTFESKITTSHIEGIMKEDKRKQTEEREMLSFLPSLKKRKVQSDTPEVKAEVIHQSDSEISSPTIETKKDVDTSVNNDFDSKLKTTPDSLLETKKETKTGTANKSDSELSSPDAIETKKLTSTPALVCAEKEKQH